MMSVSRTSCDQSMTSGSSCNASNNSFANTTPDTSSSWPVGVNGKRLWPDSRIVSRTSSGLCSLLKATTFCRGTSTSAARSWCSRVAPTMMPAARAPTTPSWRPMAVSRRISSTDVAWISRDPRMPREIMPANVTSGPSATVIQWIPYATGRARALAKVTPRVFGMISVIRSTASVNTTEKIHSDCSLNTST